MDLFTYKDLWVFYLIGLALAGVSLYFVLRLLPWRWFRWNLLAASVVFLAAPIEVKNDDWMVPGAIYFVYEQFFVHSSNSTAVLWQLLQHVAIAMTVTTLLWFGLRMTNSR